MEITCRLLDASAVSISSSHSALFEQLTDYRSSVHQVQSLIKLLSSLTKNAIRYAIVEAILYEREVLTCKVTRNIRYMIGQI